MFRSFVCIAFAAMCVSACSAPHANEAYTGTLYFALGQTLSALNLQDHHVKLVYENQRIIMNSLTKLDDKHLLLGSMWQPHRGAPVESIMQIVNRMNGHAIAYSSNMAKVVYLPRLKIIVFYGLTKAAPYHWALYWSNVSTPNQRHLIDQRHQIVNGSFGPIVVVSNHQVVYAVGIPGGNFRIKIYDFETHQSSFLNITDCDPRLWRSKTRQLLCSRVGAGHYYLVNLDGSDKERIHLGILNKGLFMVAYIKKYDVAVMSDYGGVWFSFKRGFHGTSYLYFYNFRTRKLIHISSRLAASPGVAVWYPSS